MNNYRLVWVLVCTLGIMLSAGQVATAAPPINDSCANAYPVGDEVELPFSTIEATHDGPSVFVYGANVWFCYTATCTGTVTVSLCGSYYDTKLVVYSDCECPATNARKKTWNDDSCGYQSEVTFPAICGNQYLIEVGGYSSAVGLGQMSISCDGTPCEEEDNDDCANAQTVGNVVNLAFDTTGATPDGPGAFPTNRNIWFLYTATCSGEAEISLCGSSYDTALAVYSGTNCSNLTLIGGNDDASCGQSSELTILVTAGKSYWIDIGGYSSSDTGQGILNISCEGEVDEASDLGDAPDNTNHYPSSNMRTYNHLAPAKFPTVYQDGTGIYGPIHLQPKAVAFLGDDVTFEDEADQGYDQDPTNNLIPTQLNTNANKDLADDAISTVSMGMFHCRLTSFDYIVNVIDPNEDMWVNVWVDWNRDGDWEDDGNTDMNLDCISCNSGGIVSEWAVQNQLLYDLEEGLNTVTTPGFLAWHPATGDQKVWMRITLSDEPWKGGTGAAGSGPAAGYQYGETEDYYFTPAQDCFVCEDLNRDGDINEYDLFVYMLTWIDSCYDD